MEASARRVRHTQGRPISRAAIKGLLLLVLVGVAALAFRFVGGLLLERDMARQKALEKTAIARCMESQDDEGSSLEQRRFARMACTRMRNDYRQRYGESP